MVLPLNRDPRKSPALLLMPTMDIPNLALPQLRVKLLIGGLDRLLVGETGEMWQEAYITIPTPPPPLSEAKVPESPFFKNLLLG